jgi:hypothetical protein
MKVTNLRRKLAAALVAGGMLAPSAALAADLDVNLLVNPGFEDLNASPATILNWVDGTGLGYTYNSGVYDNGGPLAGGGNFYFTPNRSSQGDVLAPGVIAQRVDLSTGDAAALIATGQAAYQVSAFFSSYLAQGDFGIVQVDFQNSSNVTLGTGMVQDGDTTTWSRHSSGGLIPVGTTSALVSLYSVAFSGGPDGYIDNVDFRVTDEVILPTLELRVNREDGSLQLSNQTGGAVNISGYQITSAFGALDPAQWISIADNYDANSGSTIDSNNIWTELTAAGAHGDLSEADLASGTGGSIGHTESISLGSAGAWIRTPVEDLVFQYISGGTVQSGLVSFENAAPALAGDVNTDGVIDAADWQIVRSNQHVPLTGLSLAEAYRQGDLTADGINNHADFVAFKSAFDAANGAGAFVAMLSGQSSVPEPASVIIVAAAGLLFAPLVRRAPRC